MTTPCIVLAGGLGTRLRSAVGDRPKCLAPVGGRPFLLWPIDALRRAGIEDVILSLGYRADQVLEVVKQSDDPALRWIVEPAALGTGGAVAHVMDSLGLDEAIVANGDTYLDADIEALSVPLEAGVLLRMAVVEVPDRSRFGGVEVAADGRVRAFVEKGHAGPGPVNAGLLRLRREALPLSREGAWSLEADVMPALAARGAIAAVRLQGRFTDIGVPDDYFAFCREHGA